MEFIIITGLSGAGKSIALNALEDIGYFCVDNIPAELLPIFYDLCEKSADNKMKRAAVVIDARGGNVFDSLLSQLQSFRAEGKDYKLLFLDASAETLLRRYKETRRKHPLVDYDNSRTLQDAVDCEINLLASLKPIADYVVDSTGLSVKLLKERVTSIFSANYSEAMQISCMSFGFKYGSPHEADLIFDVRCLPNPFYIAELKPLTGLDEPVRDYVLNNDVARGFVQRLLSLLDYTLPLYCSEGKSSLVIGVGCTGGKHRSVAIADLLNTHFIENGYSSSLHNRDISKV